ncbi:MAG: heavy metal translocating P-type ATPase, partial [Anaerolineae bacterium]|nr:heavy metal translocating P-type ATPase [Anaerolineae bacterium]
MPIDTRIYDLNLALPKAPTCESCIRRLTEALLERPGVQAVQRSSEGDKLIVDYDPAALPPGDLDAAVEVAGGAVTRRYRHERLGLIEMDCPECARTIEAALAGIPGVLTAHVEFALGQLDLSYDTHVVGREQIISRIRELGYQVAEAQPTVLRFRVEGMDCLECVPGVEGVVESIPGVVDAEINFAAGTMAVTVEGTTDLVAEITRAVASAGYTARVEAGPPARVPPRRGIWDFIISQRRGRRTLASAAAFALGAAASFLPVPAAVSILFYAVAIAAGGFDVARSALASLRTTRSIDMNLLMTVAVIGAALIGEWAEAAAVILLFSVGNTLEAYTLDRARDSVRALIELAPDEATLLRDDHEERVPVEALQVGDLVLVRPGARIPADGDIVEGSSAVDQAPITGEAIPVDKVPGDPVYAGTVNGRGALTLRVTDPPSDSTLARVVRLVEQAQAQRAPSQRFVDRFARVYTPVVIAIAAAIAIVPPLLTGAAPTPWVYRALVLLVISCPCALVISTPVAIVSAMGRAAREGVLIKGGTYLEAAGSLRAVAFDKTRTLTVGRPVVTDVLPLNGRTQEQVLAVAAALERNSEHPLAQAVVREARHRGLSPTPATGFEALPGRGARGRVNGRTAMIGNRALLEECLTLPAETAERLQQLEREGKTVFVLGFCRSDGERLPGELLGIIAVADRVRPESEPAIRALRAAGLQHIAMVTGDNASTAGAIARQVGIDQVLANLLPAQKVQAVEQLLAEHGRVAMVGDGVNDAPALARATVGIAMGAAGT